MRIAKARLIDPAQNQLYAITALALSLLVFAYSTRFGQVSILAYYALWLPLVAVDYRKVLGRAVLTPWIVAFIGFALLSTFWSQAPAVTARASVQYATHALCALIAVNLLSIRTLARGMTLGVTLVLAYSFLFGHYSYDALDGSYSFVGAFSSKNQLGLYASLGVYFALAGLFILREKGFWRLICAGVAPFSAYGLLASQSATSILATVGTLLATYGFVAVLAFRPTHRKLFLAIMLVVVAGLAPVLAGGGAADAVLGLFGKDSTLTGRTYLWSEGIAAGGLHPWAGWGYYAYWVQGFPEAERLWYEFYIPTRTGFHFHNTYIELYVELGIIGLILMSQLLLRSFLGHFARLIGDERNSTSHVLFGLMLMLMIRSFVEIDVMTPYAVGSFLMFHAAGVLVARRRERAFPAAAARPAPTAPHSEEKAPAAGGGSPAAR